MRDCPGQRSWRYTFLTPSRERVPCLPGLCHVPCRKTGYPGPPSSRSWSATSSAAKTLVDVHTHLCPPTFGSPLAGRGGKADPNGLLLWGIDELVTYHYLVCEVFRVVPPAKLPYAKFWAMTQDRAGRPHLEEPVPRPVADFGGLPRRGDDARSCWASIRPSVRWTAIAAGLPSSRSTSTSTA